jgi:hypothetical protein
MDFKRLISQISYKIEPKPEGGFIARPIDPALPSIEASTREELVQKIQQNALDVLSTEFPGLRPTSDGKTREVSFHIEHKPGGGFSIHSADPSIDVIHAADEHELQSQFLEKVLGFWARHLTPEMSKALAAQVGSANIRVVLNGKTTFRLNSSPQGIKVGDLGDACLQNGPTTASPMLTSDGATIDAKPIVPEPSNAGKILGLLILVLVLGFVLYFFYR